EKEDDDEDYANEIVATLVGDTSLPVWDDRDRAWDGPAAGSHVLRWATDRSGKVNSSRLSQAFLWRDSDGNPEALSSYKLGFVDIINGRPYIVPRGVFATAGGRGVDSTDLSDAEKSKIKRRINQLYKKVADKLGDPEIKPPWLRENSLLTDEELGLSIDPEFKEVTASAWAEFQKIDVYPADWFEEPSREELPIGKGGVFSSGGRIWGWVAQKNVVHEKYRHQQLTIQDLSPLDTTAFLRSEIALDNGQKARVGVITMNAGHHRDGAVCETEVCQFDDTRTVAGIITVGMNRNGLWFSGAAAPWISDWDRQVFSACQPSQHVVEERGVYSLRAVLTVPTPGFPSRLVASAVVDRANIALLSGAEDQPEEQTFEPQVGDFSVEIDYDKLADKIAEAIDRRNQFKLEAEAFKAELDETLKELLDDMKLEVNGGIE
ncbi:MAG TPA: hypothetical protein VHK27_07300, partial [Gammaproteobacteria bacterium]|nr:hypothetical protein [Gammaproteobacteria bacterium]